MTKSGRFGPRGTYKKRENKNFEKILQFANQQSMEIQENTDGTNIAEGTGIEPQNVEGMTDSNLQENPSIQKVNPESKMNSSIYEVPMTRNRAQNGGSNQKLP